MIMTKTLKNKKGFSLLEMLVTLVVFAVLVSMQGEESLVDRKLEVIYQKLRL